MTAFLSGTPAYRNLLQLCLFLQDCLVALRSLWNCDHNFSRGWNTVIWVSNITLFKL